ncbi:MAG TPA: MotA/TolQ/ExbB proton channel family protein, partial [Myxococcales bacterium]|nr:MotA/TolQ/ExbB proton channel family protein [Myxococcales bacterium]
LLKHALLDLKASWVMWILLALSVVDLIIILERAAFLHSLKEDIPKLAAELDVFLRGGKVREALGALQRSRSAEAAVAVAGLRHADLGPASAEKAMAGAEALQRVRLERGLAILGTVGNNAPFLGLLGTVIGVIEAFEILGRPADAAQAAASALAPQAIMSSIAEALVATAVGLFVAIPAVAAFNYFQRRLQTTAARTEALSSVVLAHLSAEVPVAQSEAA